MLKFGICLQVPIFCYIFVSTKRDNIMKDLIFTTGIAGHTDTDTKTHLFIIGIDSRRKRQQIPVTQITFGYKGRSSFVKVPVNLIDQVIKAEVLKEFGIENPSWNISDKECNLIQSVHYSFCNEGGFAFISYFAKDRRTITNIKVNINDLINRGFLDFDAIEGQFWNFVENN